MDGVAGAPVDHPSGVRFIERPCLVAAARTAKSPLLEERTGGA